MLPSERWRSVIQDVNALLFCSERIHIEEPTVSPVRELVSLRQVGAVQVEDDGDENGGQSGCNNGRPA